jgi:uncharacterized membrane protein YdjX (TVP38/TMEM64 family)
VLGDLLPAPDAVEHDPTATARFRSSRLVWLGLTALAGFTFWLLISDSTVPAALLRVYRDRELLQDALRRWGVWAPGLFVTVQALQVVIAPFPGEITGFLGGFLFGEALGFVYSTLGLTAGSLFAFAVGRWLGAPFVCRLVAPETWDRMGFLVKAEGALLCFIVYLIPGLPKDIACYLFGLSPMPFRLFALVSTVGRLPGTWALSAQGARTATGHYLDMVLVTAVVAAVALPLYYYRHQLVAWFRRVPGTR